MKPLCPPGWPRPKGYSNGMAARGRMVFTAGACCLATFEELRAMPFIDRARRLAAVEVIAS